MNKKEELNAIICKAVFPELEIKVFHEPEKAYYYRVEDGAWGKLIDGDYGFIDDEVYSSVSAIFLTGQVNNDRF